MTVTKNVALALKMLLTYRKYCPPTSIIMRAKKALTQVFTVNWGIVVFARQADHLWSGRYIDGQVRGVESQETHHLLLLLSLLLSPRRRRRALGTSEKLRPPDSCVGVTDTARRVFRQSASRMPLQPERWAWNEKKQKLAKGQRSSKGKLTNSHFSSLPPKGLHITERGWRASTLNVHVGGDDRQRSAPEIFSFHAFRAAERRNVAFRSFLKRPQWILLFPWVPSLIRRPCAGAGDHSQFKDFRVPDSRVWLWLWLFAWIHINIPMFTPFGFSCTVELLLPIAAVCRGKKVATHK